MINVIKYAITLPFVIIITLFLSLEIIVERLSSNNKQLINHILNIIIDIWNPIK